MVHILSFDDFHEAARISNFRALAKRLGATRPFGDAPLCSYQRFVAAPPRAEMGSLVYLSDIVFYAAVAWTSSEAPPPELSAIATYETWKDFHDSPLFRVSPPREGLALAARSGDLPVHLLFSTDQIDADDPRIGVPRRREGGVVERVGVNWGQIVRDLGWVPRFIASHEPLEITTAVTDYLCRENLSLANMAAIQTECGVGGLQHMDDELLLSVRGSFWNHDPGNTLIL